MCSGLQEAVDKLKLKSVGARVMEEMTGHPDAIWHKHTLKTGTASDLRINHSYLFPGVAMDSIILHGRDRISAAIDLNVNAKLWHPLVCILVSWRSVHFVA